MKVSWKNYTLTILQKIKLFENLFTLIGGLIIGILGGYGAVGFRALIQVVQGIAWGGWGNPVEFLAGIQWYWMILIPTTGGLLTGLIVYFFAPEAKGHGVPEVIESTVLKNSIIRVRVPFAKSLASAITIGTGGSVGREGPIVHIGSAIGSLFGQLTQVTKSKMKTFVGCGAAAGIAGTFNAPLAGALFAVEIILGDFGVGQFSPIIISSVAATVISHYYLGSFSSFTIPTYELVSNWEFVSYALLGFVTGAIGVVFIRMLYKSEDIFDKIQIPQYLRTMVGGTLIGGLALLFPQILGVGYESISQVLVDEMFWQVAGLLIVMKLIATSITLGSGASGGIFAPSLFLGAMTGGFIGHLGHIFLPAITAPAGAYALVGMAGLVGAATHAPLTAIVIIFEMTNDYRIILPLMLTTIVATLFSMMVQKESIYTLKLFRRGIDIHKGHDFNILRTLNVKKIKLHPIVKVKETTALGELMRLMSHSENSVFFVVDTEDKLRGYVSVDDLRNVMENADLLNELVIAEEISHPLDFTLTEETTLDRVMELFAQKDLTELPVVATGDFSKAKATIWSRDVIEAYNLEIFRRDMASGMASKLNSHQRVAVMVEVIPGFSILERKVPKLLAGQTLEGARLRNKYGIYILLVKKENAKPGEEDEIVAADPRYPLQENEIILVFGKTANVQRFDQL